MSSCRDFLPFSRFIGGCNRGAKWPEAPPVHPASIRSENDPHTHIRQATQPHTKINQTNDDDDDDVDANITLKPFPVGLLPSAVNSAIRIHTQKKKERNLNHAAFCTK